MKVFLCFCAAVSIISYFVIFSPVKDPRLSVLESKIHSIRGVRNINNGGCGLFALYITKYLDSISVPYHIVFLEDTVKHYTNHVVVKIRDEDTFIDKNGFFKSAYLSFFSYDIITIRSKEYLWNAVYNGTWNKKFKRADSVKIIKKLFN